MEGSPEGRASKGERKPRDEMKSWGTPTLQDGGEAGATCEVGGTPRIQETRIEHLPCARHRSRPWEHRSEQNRHGPCPLAAHRPKEMLVRTGSSKC